MARIEVLTSDIPAFEDEIILKYIETRSTIKATEYVKSKGVRSEIGTVNSSSDVSSLIKEGSDKINVVLLRMATEIFDGNKKSVNRRYN